MFLVLGSISDYGGGYFAWVSVEELTNTGRKYLDVNFLTFIIERRTIVLRGTWDLTRNFFCCHLWLQKRGERSNLNLVCGIGRRKFSSNDKNHNLANEILPKNGYSWELIELFG